MKRHFISLYRSFKNPSQSFTCAAPFNSKRIFIHYIRIYILFARFAHEQYKQYYIIFYRL